MSSAIIIGDLGWEYLYHLGDEAMSVASAGILSGMGVDVTLIGGKAAPTTKRYGYPAVARPGFKKAMSTAEKNALLSEVTNALEGGGAMPEAAQAVYDAVLESDVVIIGGGGNLNSSGEHHLYDRVALSRMAYRAGKPLVVSSQTVGPSLTENEVALVKELADNAACFGVREHSSGALMRSIAPEADIYEGLDDAALLAPASMQKVQDSLEKPLPNRFIVGSFTFHVGKSGVSRQQYERYLVRLLDDLAEAQDADVILIPHLGKFFPSRPGGDQLLNSRLVELSRSGRVHALPIVEADVALGITREALFTISTRYHPLIFGAAMAVPSFGLELSHYSHVRMQGALRNYGVERLTTRPSLSKDSSSVQKLVGSVMADRTGYDAHISRTRGIRRAEHLKWWEAIANLARTGDWLAPPMLAPIVPWTPKK